MQSWLTIGSLIAAIASGRRVSSSASGTKIAFVDRAEALGDDVGIFEFVARFSRRPHPRSPRCRFAARAPRLRPSGQR